MQWVYTHGGFPGAAGLPRRGGVHDRAQRPRARRHGRHVLRGRPVADGQAQRRARPGIGRLALESGATIVPVAIHGSSRVRNWKKLQFPKVTIRYGEPFRFERVAEPTREQQQGAADEVFSAIKGLYAELEAHGRAGVVARVRAERRAARQAKRAATA